MKQKLRIGRLASHLNVERFVIRYWEKEFNITPQRSMGGQRFYNQSDVKKFETIQHLLHDKKFTIEGARKIFSEAYKHNNTISFQPTVLTALSVNQNEVSSPVLLRTTYHKLRELRSQLYKLRTTLGGHDIKE